MLIEQTSGWCCYNQALLCGENVKEESSSRSIDPQRKDAAATTIDDKSVRTNYHNKRPFSFKKHAHRVLSPQTITSCQSLTLRNSRSPTMESRMKIQTHQKDHTLMPILTFNSPPYPQTSMNSPRIVYIEKRKVPPSKIYSNLYSLTIQPEKPKQKWNIKVGEGFGKMQGKRIKTAQEQTEYSSKHSQILWMNSNEGDNSTYPNFQKKSNGAKSKVTIFQEYNESDLSFQQNEFPSCNEVSAREEADISISNEHIFHLRKSIPAISKSPEMRSKRVSREPSNTLTFAKILQSPNCSSPRQSSQIPDIPALKNHQYSTPADSKYMSPRFSVKNSAHQSPVKNNTSLGVLAQRIEGQKINSSFFYNQQSSENKDSSPRVSYLSILNIDRQNSDSQQLRDVISNQILVGKGFSKNSSPFGSIDQNSSPFGSVNQSSKNVEEKKNNKMVCFQDAPQEFITQTPSELKLLARVQKNQKRTNTFESMDTSFSQRSILDIKFMQKHRSRRQVSKLIRQ